MSFDGNLRLKKLGGGMYRPTFRHMEIHPCPTGHWPFGAAAQKREQRKFFIIVDFLLKRSVGRMALNGQPTFVRQKEIAIFTMITLSLH